MVFSLNEYGSARVAVVIMARNEVRTIGEIAADARRFAHEVVVMDGRSSDGTAAAARAAGARVVADEGRGKGAALRQALTSTDADVIVFMDADGSHDPRDVPSLALPVVRNQADVCVGSRFTGGSEELSVSVAQLVRTIGNVSMNIAINKRWTVELTDTLNGFRAVRRSVALAIGLRERRHTIEQEIVMKALRNGYRVTNVPTHEYARRYGASHISVWREWPLFVWCVVANICVRDRARRPAAAPVVAGECADLPATPAATSSSVPARGRTVAWPASVVDAVHPAATEGTLR